tara:strand:+ start:609 stop:1046 length:438 start_codon:yes stop_codon:yes gene_type:complete
VDTSNDMTSDDFDNIRLLYTVSVSDIANFKQTQWYILNQSLVLFGALATIEHSFEFGSGNNNVIFVIAGFLIWLAGCGLLQRLDGSIEARRERLKNCRLKLGDKFIKAWKTKHSGDSLLWFFESILMLAFIAYTFFICVAFAKSC